MDDSVIEAPYYKSYILADSAWEKAAFEQKDPVAAAEAYAKLEEAWNDMPKFVQDEKAHYYALSAITTARLLVQSNQYEKAFDLLQGMGGVATSHPAAPSHGKSATAFQDLARVHAAVMAATGRDPLKGSSVGYEWARHENGFAAIQQDLEVNRGGPKGVIAAVEDLEDSETTATLLLFDSKGELIETVPVAVDRSEGKRGSLLDRITTAYKLVSDGGPRHPVRAPIAGFLSKIGKVESDGSRPAKTGVESGDSSQPRTTDEHLAQSQKSPSNGKWMAILLAAGLLSIALSVLLSKRRRH